MLHRYLPAFYLFCITLNVFSSSKETTSKEVMKYEATGDSGRFVGYSQRQEDNSNLTCTKTTDTSKYHCACSIGEHGDRTKKEIKQVFGGALCSINHASDFERLKRIYLAQQAAKKKEAEAKNR